MSSTLGSSSRLYGTSGEKDRAAEPDPQLDNGCHQGRSTGWVP